MKPKRKPYYKQQLMQPDNGWRRDLRGMSHTQMINMRGFKGSKLGPASAGRRLSYDERKAVEVQLRAAGRL